MRTNTRLVLPFFYALLISACSNNDNYPKEYIGFEKQFISHTYDTKNEEETLTLKIIAAEKQDTDRKLTISSSTSNNSFHIQNAHPVILKGKKSVKIYNPQIQISAESETKRSIFREKDKTKRSKKESAQHSKSRNKSFVMTSVSAL